jgi:hypothetical protein
MAAAGTAAMQTKARTRLKFFKTPKDMRFSSAI